MNGLRISVVEPINYFGYDGMGMSGVFRQRCVNQRSKSLKQAAVDEFSVRSNVTHSYVIMTVTSSTQHVDHRTNAFDSVARIRFN